MPTFSGTNLALRMAPTESCLSDTPFSSAHWIRSMAKSHGSWKMFETYITFLNHADVHSCRLCHLFSRVVWF